MSLRSLPLAAALRVHSSAMRFDDVAHDGEAEPESAVDAGAGILRLPEWLEHMRNESRIDSLAAVLHRDFHVRGCPPCRDFNDAVARREFNGVGEQVPHNLLQTGG